LLFKFENEFKIFQEEIIEPSISKVEDDDEFSSLFEINKENINPLPNNEITN
jgi:hypothetical protein